MGKDFEMLFSYKTRTSASRIWALTDAYRTAEKPGKKNICFSDDFL